MAQARFDLSGFALRLIVALVLVFGTFNPTGYSFYHWAFAANGNLPLVFIAGVAILILYVIYLRATWRAIGPIGLTLAAAFFGGIIWALVDFGLIDTAKPTVMTYVLLVLMALILTVGISWSHIRRRVSGQSDMDDLDS